MLRTNPYALTDDELKHLSDRSFEAVKPPAGAGAAIVASLLFGSGLVLLASVPTACPGNPTFVAALGLVFVLLGALGSSVFVLSRLIKKSLQSKVLSQMRPPEMREFALEVDEEEVRLIYTSGVVVRTPLSVVRRNKSEPRDAIIVGAQNLVVSLPDRAFESDVDRDAFRTWVEELPELEG